MANRESSGHGPMDFNSLVQGNFTKDEIGGWQNMDTGFRRYGEKVAETLERYQGLGRVHGVPLGDPNRDKDAFYGAWVALPHTDESVTDTEKSVVLLVPHHNDQVYYVKVQPRRVSLPDSSEERIENEINVRIFDDLYLPSDTPYIHKSWPQGILQSPYEVLRNNQEQFGLRIAETCTENTKDMFWDKVMQTSRTWKLRHTRTDDVGLEAILGGDVIGDLTVFSKEFDNRFEQWGQKLFADPPEDDPRNRDAA
jgi:hypothetical protein